MQCPNCSAIMPEEDLFCEECGTALKTPAPDAPVCLCGAPSGDLDDDGYCLQCGRRCRPSPGDHEEYSFSDHSAAVTDKGRQHLRNEDRCAVACYDNTSILIVCDGVSSSSNAQLASQTALTSILEALQAGEPLASALASAAANVASLAGGLHGEVAPSTTVVAAVVKQHHAQIAWLGDSRAYWIADAGSQQLTRDHSWVNEAVAAGELSYADALKSPRAHGITRWLGADADAAMQPEFTEFDAPAPGILLLCSDGLWNYADDLTELQRLVLTGAQETASDVARRLVTFANEQGGKDNISVAILRLGDPSA